MNKNTYNYNSALIDNSQKLRKSMTPEERAIWYRCLSLLPISVHRQKMIENYIVDFYIAKKKIVIELDGIQHEGKEHKARDQIKDRYLENKGITVLRYSNETVNQSFSWL